MQLLNYVKIQLNDFKATYNVILLHNYVAQSTVFVRFHMPTMDIIGVSRSNILNSIIISNYGGSVQNFCTATGEDYGAIHKYVNQALRIGDRVARRLEKVMELTNGYLDKSIPKFDVTEVPVITTRFSSNEQLKDLISSSVTLSAVENDLIENYKWNKEALVMIIAEDNSMEPTIRAGIQVIIDCSQREIIQNKIYAIRIHDDIYLRRINKSQSTGMLIISPDSETYQVNNQFKSFELDHNNYEVIGKAVFIKGAL